MQFTDRSRQRLSRETVGWFTTVNPAGRPITLPVWYLWDGDDEILIYSLTNAARLRNIAANPNVSFHLDGDKHGGEIVVLEGVAEVDPMRPPANEVAAYLDRYRGYMAAYGWTPEWFAGRYSVAIGMKIDNVRAW
ncbi:MAG: TIGR03667 family PPOX class F420-dependent oxidoreductase [Acidimicrobiia bacterium]|nr:TIGR03667 family PPOX class F420-dependent oxidoreductase [Acidimicrobiia bacterium]